MATIRKQPFHHQIGLILKYNMVSVINLAFYDPCFICPSIHFQYLLILKLKANIVIIIIFYFILFLWFCDATK